MKHWILAGAIGGLGLAGLQAAELTPEHGRAIGGFLEQHCVKCHGPEEQKGKLRLDTLAPPPDQAAAAGNAAGGDDGAEGKHRFGGAEEGRIDRERRRVREFLG